MKRKPGWEDPAAFNHVSPVSEEDMDAVDKELDRIIAASPQFSSTGTPATLLAAVAGCINGLRPMGLTESEFITQNVRDYLAQCFTAELMEDPKIKALWFKITNERK